MALTIVLNGKLEDCKDGNKPILYVNGSTDNEIIVKSSLGPFHPGSSTLTITYAFSGMPGTVVPVPSTVSCNNYHLHSTFQIGLLGKGRKTFDPGSLTVSTTDPDDSFGPFDITLISFGVTE